MQRSLYTKQCTAGMDPPRGGHPQLGFKPKLGVLGVENKLKNEVKIKKFPYKISLKPKILHLLQATLVK